MYHSCGGKDGQYQPLEKLIPPTDFDYEYPSGCLRSMGSSNTLSDPPCALYYADEWLTYQVSIKIGTWYLNDGNYHRDSQIRLWVAREGQPSRLVIDFDGYDLANNNPNALYGKLWLLPYHTGKSATQDHEIGYIWYDEIIISTQKISDPN